MAALSSAGPQQWAPWHGGQGVDVVVSPSRARCGRAESLPVDWKVQAETFPSSNCPVPAQGGLSHCTRWHSSECPSSSA